MLDFVSIEEEQLKRSVNIYPEFIVNLGTKDLMIRGKSFYAVWDEEAGFWSSKEKEVQRMVDDMLYQYVKDHSFEVSPRLKLMSKYSTNSWVVWQKYCKSLPDNYTELDKKIIFSNSKVCREDYATKRLSYPLKAGSIQSYEELMSVLYEPEERQKLEWAIGSIIKGDSKKLQKFIVLYGGPGTGKSTVLNIIQELFEGYYETFDAKGLGTASSTFALESFRNNPLIAIQHDGDLSRIEDNARLNSIVSHEPIIINEKFKATYTSRIHSFLFMGTNKPVRITDAKSGILRRLIDVSPTGNKIPRDRFEYLMGQIKFELSGIAWHCLQVYEKLGYKYYDNYIPEHMIGITNDFYNFIEDDFDFFSNDSNGITLKSAWMRYKEYCEDARVPYPLSMRTFRHELENYFEIFESRSSDGRRSVYFGFMRNKFRPSETKDNDIYEDIPSWLHLSEQTSEFDDIFKDYPAQYATSEEIPKSKWENVTTTLKDLNTRRLHYILPGEDSLLIVLDFDRRNEKGEKDERLNLEAAATFPQTYAELSKGGSGLHLHYFYDGDPNELSRLFGPDIEIKIFTGKSSLRRKLIRCNDIPIARISSGLPLKERNRSMLKEETVKSEKGLRNLIIRNLRKEIHPNTKPSIDFIHKILEDAYASGLKYDVEDLRPDIQAFALDSSHQGDYCLRMVGKMKFKSEEPSENFEIAGEDVPIIIYDMEVIPNLLVIAWKKKGADRLIKMINPSPSEVEELTKFRLVGFNNRNYDNHIFYARMMGYTNEQLFELSQRIISNDKNAKFGEAYNLSYTDIYDFLSAANKMSLKKWEIKLGIRHMELGLPWDQPVPEELWPKVAEYCGIDVIAAEAVWDSKWGQADWRAREILAEWAEMTVNDTTNSLTTKLIVGNDRNPQEKFIYTDLSTIFPGYEYSKFGIDPSRYKEGVKIVRGKSFYKGKDPGEGGYAIGYPGIYYWVDVDDVESMHPHSAITLKIFGEEYTRRFEEIVEARMAIKHKDFETAKKILPERLWKYLDDTGNAKALANALKTAINSVYGLTSASFPNKLRDPRNEDNIVAKYGALFMINLEEEVGKLGFPVVHIKTDSIKVENSTPELLKFISEYGKKYGYNFEHECVYEKICLVNDAVYIAKYANPEWCMQKYGYIPEGNQEHGGEWTATGTQFQVPYVFKTLFSKEPVEFEDLCETKSVTTAMYLDFNEDLPDVSSHEKERDILTKKIEKDMVDRSEGMKNARDRIEELSSLIEKGHDYRFIGKVGSFCPVKDGYGGGILLRDGGGKYSAVVGTKRPDGSPYRWMEAEMAKDLPTDAIDLSYYNFLVDKAVETINKYGDFDQFVSDYVPDDFEWMHMSPDTNEELPFPMNEPEE